jgi:DNA-binding transcriptional LysR family regulator
MGLSRRYHLSSIVFFLAIGLVAPLRDFHREFPTVPVRLMVETLGGVERVLRSDAAAIGVGSPLHMDTTGLRRFDIAGVRMIPVAVPGHPLARESEAGAPRPRDFVQLVLSDQPAREGQEFGVVSLNTWRVGDLTARHKLLLAGIGWACRNRWCVPTSKREGWCD